MEKEIYYYYHHRRRRRLLMKERWIMGKFCFSVKQEKEEEINEPVSSLVMIYHNHTPCLKR